MRHFGDITKLKGAELPAVDVVCGGSPCQDLSVAGKREGLSGARSGLFIEQIRVIKELRNECVRQLQLRGSNVDMGHVRPRYMVWENVQGAFSSNKGEDFRIVLEETARIAQEDAVIPEPPKGGWSYSGCILGDGWSIAWRLHDAQFWGVPQRRKRISLVADFGGESAPEILFERKGVSGDPKESREPGERVTGITDADTTQTISFQERAGCEGGARESSSNGTEQEPCLHLTTNLSCNSMNIAYRKTSHPKRPEGGQGWAEAEVNDTLNAFDSGETRTPTLVLENHPQDSRLKIKEDGIFQTMGARGGKSMNRTRLWYWRTTWKL